MSYFSRRNNYITEFSGHEEITSSLKDRIKITIKKYTGSDLQLDSTLNYKVNQEFPEISSYLDVLDRGTFDKVFTVVEIFSDTIFNTYIIDALYVEEEIKRAFELSGSVYTLHNRRVQLKVDEDFSERLEETKEILSPYEEWYHTFYQAVGDLFGRRRNPEDIVSDVYIALEGYLKKITGKNTLGQAASYLESQGSINSAQKSILDNLNKYRSNNSSIAHAGQEPAPTEAEAYWFVETAMAQIRAIDKAIKT